MSFEQFELRRMSDDLVYVFVRQTNLDGEIGYRRADRDLWILKKPDLGWVAWDEASDSVMGRPWNVLLSEQGDHPPEGEWVSKKGAKSYIYLLVYV